MTPKQEQSTTHEGKLLANNSLLGLWSSFLPSPKTTWPGLAPTVVPTGQSDDGSSLDSPSSQITLACSHQHTLSQTAAALTLPGNVGPVDGSQLQFWSARLNSLTSRRPLPPSVIIQWRNALSGWPKCDKLSKHNGHLPLLPSALGAQNSLVLPLDSWLSLPLPLLWQICLGVCTSV